MNYLAIDNGVTGRVAVLFEDGRKAYFKMPTFKCRNYTKHESHVTRIDTAKLRNLLKCLNLADQKTLAVLERPMINPGRFRATISAARSLEATLITLEGLDIKYRFLDSKAWQQDMLGKVEDTKKASLEKGKKLFKEFEIKDDADPLLMALWAQQTKLGFPDDNKKQRGSNKEVRKADRKPVKSL